MQNRKKWLLLAIILLSPINALALPSDSKQPINIESDQGQVDNAKGMAKYSGNAILTQGTLKITGRVITFYFDKNHQLIKAVAVGKLATYQQINKPNELPIKAKAQKMEYYANAQKIHLIGDAYVNQNGNEIKGNKIVYDIQTSSAVAESTIKKGSNSSGRIHVTIQPKNSSGKPAVQSTSKAHNTASVVTTSNQRLTSTTVNLRNGPSTQYKVLTSLPASTPVKVMSTHNGWSQVSAKLADKTVVGWLTVRYLK